MTGRLNDMQLDALRELANISSGTAATSLSQMLGRQVDLNVPKAFALPLADAVDAAGDPAKDVTGIVLNVEGDVAGAVLLLVPPSGAATLCNLLGVEPGTEVGDSALGEIGNILGAAYLNALSSMTGPLDAAGPTAGDHRPARSDRGLRARAAPPATAKWPSCSTPSWISPASRARSPSCCCLRREA